MSMSHEELKHKESVLRECFKEKLEMLNVDGQNTMDNIKRIKTYGVLWHLVHQLCMAEAPEATVETKTGSFTEAETMDIKATGLKMTGSVK